MHSGKAKAQEKVSMGRAALAIATVALAAFGATGQQPLETFHEVLVATIQPGSGPTQVSLTGCEDCADACPAVFAFLGPSGSPYIYDPSRNNLKVVDDPSLKGSNIRVVEGPHLIDGETSPHDGAVDASGTIYLVSDQGSLTNRYVMFRHSHRDSTWERSDPFDDPDIGVKVVNGKRLPQWQAIRIATDSRERALVFDSYQSTSSRLIVAESGAFLPKSARTRLEPGEDLTGGRFLRASNGRLTVRTPTGERSVQTRGRFLGLDSTGNAYSLDFTPGVGYSFGRYSPEGVLLATAPRPIRRTIRMLAGKGPYFVTATGDVLMLRVTNEGVLIARWTTRS